MSAPQALVVVGEDVKMDRADEDFGLWTKSFQYLEYDGDWQDLEALLEERQGGFLVIRVSLKVEKREWGYRRLMIQCTYGGQYSSSVGKIPRISEDNFLGHSNQKGDISLGMDIDQRPSPLKKKEILQTMQTTRSLSLTSLPLEEPNEIYELGPLYNHIIEPLAPVIQEKVVACFVGHDRNWHWPHFKPWLTKEVVQSIVAIHPSTKAMGVDELKWALKANGEFSIRSAYFVIQIGTWGSMAIVWNHVWHW
ncbi:hypothetical protein Ancab_007585 [Ancistrocladus abbreviatus]